MRLPFPNVLPVACSGLLLWFALGACNSYDGGALNPPMLEVECGDGRWGGGELCDTAIAAGEPGACPERCESEDACELRLLVGADCQRECVASVTTLAIHGDGCCPQGLGPADDGDCGECGDGIVGPTETCDPPETCLSLDDCGQWGACVRVRLTGSTPNCNARCELTNILTCTGGDACCPAGCNSTNDADCSQSCGNGVLESGETCEAGSASPCPAACEPAGTCMTPVMSGSPANCNVECAYTAITAPRNGDDCCPPGAHTMNDDDCLPRCGNAVTEPPEACDGGEYCHPDCTALTQAERCAVVEGASSSACTTCACDHCAQLTLSCFESGNADRDLHCTEVTECARETGCVGDACYCGTSANCAYPNGQCRMAIEAAANAGGVTVAACQDDPDCATYWAGRLGECRRTYCTDECNL